MRPEPLAASVPQPRLYLMSGALHRPFDSASFAPEASAVVAALQAVVAGRATLLCSYAHLLDAETFSEPAGWLLNWLVEQHAQVVAPAADVDLLASTLYRRFSFSGPDSLHVACAAWRGATHVVTPDRTLAGRTAELRLVVGPGLAIIMPDELAGLPAVRVGTAAMAAADAPIAGRPTQADAPEPEPATAETAGADDPAAWNALAHATTVVTAGGGSGDWAGNELLRIQLDLAAYNAAARDLWIRLSPERMPARLL